MKRLYFAFLGSLLFAALGLGLAVAASPNLSGTWAVEQTGRNGTTTGTITLKQSGNGLVGNNAKTGVGYTATFVNTSQMNGTWHGPGGAGWLTVYVSPNGHSFNGTWGYHGREANGSFVGNKVLPPSKISAAGTWNVQAAGGNSPFAGAMSCKQSGATAICKLGDIAINGKFRSKDKVRATWTRAGQSGWFSFWFNNDNNSFNGLWGRGAPTNPAEGRVVGQRAF